MRNRMMKVLARFLVITCGALPHVAYGCDGNNFWLFHY
jgi:hypothetical protein